MIESTTKSLITLISAALLASCANQQSTPTKTPKPDPRIASVNGYQVERNTELAATGHVELGISPLTIRREISPDQTLQSVEVNITRVVDLSTLNVATLPVVEDDLEATAISPYQVSVASCKGNLLQGTTALNANLMLDTTGSMTSTDPQSLRVAASQDFVNRMRPSDFLSVAIFDTSTQPDDGLLAAKVLSPVGQDKVALIKAIESAKNGGTEFGGGGTNLVDAMYDAVTLVNKQNVAGTKMAIVLTDGEDNSSSRTVKEVIDYARSKNIIIQGVGLNTGAGNTPLNVISSRTGGLFAYASTAKELKNIMFGLTAGSRAQDCVALEFTPTPAPQTAINVRIKLKYASGANPTVLYRLVF